MSHQTIDEILREMEGCVTLEEARWVYLPRTIQALRWLLEGGGTREHVRRILAGCPPEYLDCTEACEAMPRCSVCEMPKHPRGRDPGVYGADSYCQQECPGHYIDPHPGHLWPGELCRILAGEEE